MLSSISPVGEAARRQRWPLTAGAYLLGSALGGLVVGAFAGGLGHLALAWLDDRTALGVLAGVGAVGLLADATGRLPSWRRQVDERWLTSYRGWVYGLGFGVQLGAGVVTIVASSAVYVALAAAALTRSAAAGAIVGLIYGTARGLPLVLGATTTTVAALRARLALVERWRRPAALATGAAQGLVAAVALAAVWV